MKKVKSIGKKLVVLLIFGVLCAAMTFSASAHSLTPWSKAYNYDNAGGTHQFAIQNSSHISGRTFNYCWKNDYVKNNFESALKDAAALWDGMISIKETSRSEAHAVIRYSPEECNNTIIYDDVEAAAFVRINTSSDHIPLGAEMAEMVIGDITDYSHENKSQILAHELGHLWGIDDVYYHNGEKGKQDLDSIYSQTNLIPKPTIHDKNAMFIGINKPWFVDANGKVKYQKSVSASGVVTWAKGETYNGHTFDSSGYLTDGAKITYNANGGTRTPAAQYKVPGFDLRLTSDQLDSYQKYHTITIDPNGGTLQTKNKTEVYCDFIEWNTSASGNGTSYQSEQLYPYSSSATLYAQWKNPTAGACSLLDDKPTRAGYRFHNWYTNPTGSGGSYVVEEPNYTYTFTKDTTVYALWIANTYTINYNANGGDVYPKTDSVKGNASTTLPTPEKRYVLTYDANGGSVSDTGKGVNCSFNGWYTAATGGTKLGNAGASYRPCDYDTTTQNLYAQWRNPTAGTLEIPTRDGYVFTGWYTAPTGGTQVTSSTAITGDVKLYAHWGPADGIYNLKNVNSGQYLDISTLNDGTACIQWPLDQVKSQKWKVTHLGNGEYELRPLLRLTSAMGLGNAGNVNGATVGIWDTTSYPAYRWKLNLNEDGSFSLMSQASGYTKALAIAGGSTAKGAACTQQTVTGAPGEKWAMEPADVLPLETFVSGTLKAGEAEWYSFVPTVSGEYSFISDKATKNIKGTFIGGNYSNIGAIGNDFLIEADLTAGTTYYIKIEGVNSSESGSFDIGVFRGTSIYNQTGLNAVRNNPSRSYFLMRDINLSGINWEPIPSFSGTFNGNGYTIRGLRVDRPAQKDVGLFGSISGSIDNLTLEAIQVTGVQNTGGLAGSTTASGAINNCHITGDSSVTGSECTGGLVGFNWATITNSSTSCSVKATGNFSGGLVGDNYNAIIDCHTTGNINATNYAGGLIGNCRREGHITNCYATGNVNGLNRTGGLVGSNDAYINTSYATGNVRGGFNVGGFVGRNEMGSITSCYSTGSVDVLYDYGGGFVGYINIGGISQCYSLSSVNGAETKIMGGFVGYGDSSSSRIANSFACADMQPSSNSAGFAGFMNGKIVDCYTVSNNETGFIKSGSATVTDCYFSDVYGGVDTKATAKTPAEMLALTTYAGWNFSNVWEMDGVSEYPTLQGLAKPSSFQNIGNTFTVDSLVYTITSPMTAQVKTSVSVSGAVAIPSVVSNGTESYTVTSIGAHAFSSRSLTSVTIPATVVNIDTCAFQSCKSLTNVTFAADSRLKTIGDHAFNGCSSLTGITIPATVTRIEGNAFQTCPVLTDITFAAGSKLESIGDHAFNSCGNLTGITIPDTVVVIGNSAFQSCQSLASVAFGEDSQLQIIGGHAFNSCRGLTDITIPAAVNTMGGNVFQSCTGLTDITFAAGCKPDIIGPHTFNGCTSLTRISIPDSVMVIENNAFKGCSALTSVTFGAKSQLTTLSSYAFYDCGNLEQIYLPSSLKNIGSYAFTFCKKLPEIVIPSGVTSLPSKVFYGCSSLRRVDIPASVTSIVPDAFIGCNDVTWYVEYGSYAHTYAITNSIRFECPL